MFKKILITTAFIAIIGLLVFGAVNRTLAKNGTEYMSAGQDGYRYGNHQVWSSSDQVNGEDVNGKGNSVNGMYSQYAGANGISELSNLPPAVSAELSAEETADLLYLREEEKLAHDVYVTFYAQWGLPVFQNISQSELTHTEAIKTLLDRYGLSDPASEAVGVFTNPDLQVLYNELVARGSQSLAEALKVGAEIEEIDILDLQKKLARTDNADIQQILNNLLNGSYNHLQAFVSTLNTQVGETYQPQYLSAETYQDIISASAGGNGYGNRGNQRGGRP